MLQQHVSIQGQEMLEEDAYGICAATGEQIPRGWLEVMPEAVYTIGARRALEKRS
jgi:RNA polymerase-binding transcription factor DksA